MKAAPLLILITTAITSFRLFYVTPPSAEEDSAQLLIHSETRDFMQCQLNRERFDSVPMKEEQRCVRTQLSITKSDICQHSGQVRGLKKKVAYPDKSDFLLCIQKDGTVHIESFATSSKSTHTVPIMDANLGPSRSARKNASCPMPGLYTNVARYLHPARGVTPRLGFANALLTSPTSCNAVARLSLGP